MFETGFALVIPSAALHLRYTASSCFPLLPGPTAILSPLPSSNEQKAPSPQLCPPSHPLHSRSPFFYQAGNRARRNSVMSTAAKKASKSAEEQPHPSHTAAHAWRSDSSLDSRGLMQCISTCGPCVISAQIRTKRLPSGPSSAPKKLSPALPSHQAV